MTENKNFETLVSHHVGLTRPVTERNIFFRKENNKSNLLTRRVCTIGYRCSSPMPMSHYKRKKMEEYGRHEK